MGVRRLLYHLEPYGEITTVSADPSTLANEPSKTAVIDGPSLAYHVYHLCQSKIPRTSNPFEAIPSYTDIGSATVEWLNWLQGYHFDVQAIYFDGLLPAQKTAERQSRLADAAVKLRALKLASTRGFRPMSSMTDSRPSDTPSSSTASTPMDNLLGPAPFLVNAVIVALLASHFAAITKIIPGEADAFCASFARDHKHTTIISNDSDLLLYDIGKSGNVLLLKHIEEMQSSIDTPHASFKATKYHPPTIAARLDLPNLVAMAHILSREHHKSLTEIVAQAKSSDLATDDEYTNFQALFGPTKAASGAVRVGIPGLDGLLSKLDPRVSEIIQQIHSGQSSMSDNIGTLAAYLPPLIDDPDRAAAWTIASETRRLAYSTLALLTPSLSRYGEYHRRGNRVSAVPTSFLTHEQLATAARRLASQLETSSARFASADNMSLRWRAQAAFLIQITCRDEEKSLPTTKSLVNVVTHRRVSMTWDHIHLSAQVQAVLYSLRMLHQVLEYYLLQSGHARCMNGPRSYRATERTGGLHGDEGCEEDDTTFRQLNTLLTVLRETLDSLPDISGLFDGPTSPYPAETERCISQGLSLNLDQEIKAGGSKVEDDNDGRPSPTASEPGRKKRKKSKGATDDRRGARVNGVVRGNNPFAALGMDMDD